MNFCKKSKGNLFFLAEVATDRDIIIISGCLVQLKYKRNKNEFQQRISA